MKEIIFSDINNNEIVCLQNFVFSDAEEDGFPYWDYGLKLNTELFSVSYKQVTGDQDEISLFEKRLNKVLKKEYSKCFFFGTIDDCFRISFERKEDNNIKVTVDISFNRYEDELNCIFQFDMNNENLIDLLKQIREYLIPNLKVV